MIPERLEHSMSQKKKPKLHNHCGVFFFLNDINILIQSSGSKSCSAIDLVLVVAVLCNLFILLQNSLFPTNCDLVLRSATFFTVAAGKFYT